MKIVVTGSLGHISKPLTQELVQKGHSVTVVSSNPEKQKDIEALGAVAAIGSMNDIDFLTATFTGADAVYSMIPPANYFDHSLDLLGYYQTLGNNYAKAILQSGVKRLVHLSSIGAHLQQGSGILLGTYHVEQILSELPENVAITFMRPTSFYYNLNGNVAMIKAQGFIAANYGVGHKIPWVSPIDIAAAIAEEIATQGAIRKVRYVVSEELTGQETASILGEAIGQPGLQWTLTPNEKIQNSLVAIGMNPQIAAGLVEMYGSLGNGLLAEDYYQNNPAEMGKVKLADFAQEFAAVYKQN